MPKNRRNPYEDLPKPPPLKGESATEVMPALRDADLFLTSVQPLPGLRDALRPVATRYAPSSALDLPLWRPGVYNPPVLPPPVPTPVEQTAIEKVLEGIAGHSHSKAFRDLLHELRDAFREEAKDQADVYLNEQNDVHTELRDLDVWATQNGFKTAAARFIGRRLALRELTPDDAVAELNALG